MFRHIKQQYRKVLLSIFHLNVTLQGFVHRLINKLFSPNKLHHREVSITLLDKLIRIVRLHRLIRVVSDEIYTVFFLCCREFKDSSSEELCLPATLTQQERAYIKQAAQDMGLRVDSNEVKWMLNAIPLKIPIIRLHPPPLPNTVSPPDNRPLSNLRQYSFLSLQNFAEALFGILINRELKNRRPWATNGNRKLTVPFVGLFLLLVLDWKTLVSMSGGLSLLMLWCQNASKENKSTSGCRSWLRDVCA